MSGQVGANGTAVTVPQLVRNDYFTYANGKRETTQIWNIRNNLTVYVQGHFPNGVPAASGIAVSHFAKKHLLTFAGGTAHSTHTGGALAGMADKATRITARRMSGNKDDKYGKKLGGSLDSAKNTVVMCDLLSKDELWKAFAAALDDRNRLRGIKQKGLANVYFPTKCVYTFKASGAQFSNTYGIQVGWACNAAGTVFVIYHLQGAVN